MDVLQTVEPFSHIFMSLIVLLSSLLSFSDNYGQKLDNFVYVDLTYVQYVVKTF